MDFACRRYADEHSNGPTAMARLSLLKDAIRDTAKYIKNKEKDKEATTIAHRLASTLSFIRAIECGDMGLAQKL